MEATVTSHEIHEKVLTASITANVAPPRDAAMAALRELLSHEPYLHQGLNRPSSTTWEVKVPAALRAYRGVVTAEDYIEQVTEQVSPAQAPSVPLSSGPLDIPYGVGYLDAVWKNRTGLHLFVNLDPSSVARLTLPCGGEEEFNSLMSALADVLGQAVVPGKTAPPQGGALEAVRDYLIPLLAPEACDYL